MGKREKDDLDETEIPEELPDEGEEDELEVEDEDEDDED